MVGATQAQARGWANPGTLQNLRGWGDMRDSEHGRRTSDLSMPQRGRRWLPLYSPESTKYQEVKAAGPPRIRDTGETGKEWKFP